MQVHEDEIETVALKQLQCSLATCSKRRFDLQLTQFPV